jgi:hypothetical protein
VEMLADHGRVEREHQLWVRTIGRP